MSPRQGRCPPCPHTPFPTGLPTPAALPVASLLHLQHCSQPGALGPGVLQPLLGGPHWAGVGLIPRQNSPPTLRGASPLSQTGLWHREAAVGCPGHRSRGLPGAGVLAEPSLQVWPVGTRPACHCPGLPAQGPTLSLSRPPERTAQWKEGGVPCEGSISLPRTWARCACLGCQLTLSHGTQTNPGAIYKDLATPSGTTNAGFPTATAHCRVLLSP